MAPDQPNQNLILFTIGPVQRFIVQARKTEDLWLGSYILSYLNATAIDKIYGEDGIELIFPSIGNQAPFDFWQSNDITIPSFPNRFLAISQSLSRTDLKQMMEKTEQAVLFEFKEIAKHALNVAFGSGKWRTTYFADLFDKQVKNFLEIYWVVSPYSSEGYSASTDLIERRLASIKNCRAFIQLPEEGRKCSLCGEREILHLCQQDSVREAMKWWEHLASIKPKYCRENEALCAVCLTKRVGSDSAYFTQEKFLGKFSGLTFPSTSEVSTAAFKNELLTTQKDGKNALGMYSEFVTEVKKLKRPDSELANIPYVNLLPKISQQVQIPKNIDGDWLFEESFLDENLKRYYGIDTSSRQQGQIQKCKDKRKLLTDFLEREPSRYYAVIALDGDSMGKTIAQAASKDEHTGISAKLSGYTTRARDVVQGKHLGKLIYAGGDDVLALANLSDLLKILKGLRDEFPPLIEGKDSTASAGVCIAHCKVPLGEVLRWASKMEKEAKKIDGKDALGIALLKHSGNISQTVVKWKYSTLDVTEASEELLDVVEASEGLMELLKEKDVSKKFMYTFREAFAKLVDKEGKLNLDGTLVEAELKRLIERAANEQIEPGKIKPLVDLLNKIKHFSNFLNYLEIIIFIVRGSK